MLSLKHLRFSLGVIGLLISQIAVTSAQNERGLRCQPLNTEYPYLSSTLRWLDSDSLVFQTWNGVPQNAAFETPSYVWYQYHLSTSILEKLDESPFSELNLSSDNLDKLTNVVPGANGLYENVSISPSQDVLVYPRQSGDSVDYWLVNNRTNTEIKLGVGEGAKEILWSADEYRFVIQGSNTAPNVLTPITLVSISDGKVQLEPLESMPILSNVLLGEGFTVHGLSPDGNYLLIRPESMESITWVLNIEQQTVNKLDFLLSTGTQVIWLNSSTFIGITNIGAIQYDLETGKQEILASSDELGLYDPELPLFSSLVVGGGSLSPDGRYLVASRSQQGYQDIAICTIY